MKYSELVKQGQVKLFKAGIGDAGVDAWILLENICNISRTDYFVKMHDEVPCEYVSIYLAAIDKRLTHYPLQYILGEWHFMGLRFKVNENVLIPRQDTEILVVKILNMIQEEFKNQDNIKILDMCTGSGCIGISLAKLCNKVEVTAVDLSKEAIVVARENARMNDVKNIHFIESDLFKAFNMYNDQEPFDIIVSNPPYICSKEIESLMAEVKNFEPRMALDGDEDGLVFYKRIVDECNPYIKKGGYLAFEIGWNQAEDVKELMRSRYDNLEVVQDLACLDRVVVGKRK